MRRSLCAQRRFLIEAKVKTTDKFLATISGSWEQAKTLYERGYPMISLMMDGNALAAVAADAVATFRKEFP